ncbi:MAG: hypothetical protein ACXWJW_04830 [Xanthobacteraceae bacterium]
MRTIILALCTSAPIALTAFVLSEPAGAQMQGRCEPTLSNPCKPQPNVKPNTLDDTPKPRPATRLDPQSAIPEIKVDKDTSMGFGQGGGIFGLERKLRD